MKIPVTCKCGSHFNAVFDDTATGMGIVRCPKCKTAIQVALPMQDNNDDQTILPSSNDVEAPGTLHANGREYQLEIGDNIVGRRSTTSSATIQLDVNAPYMSRQPIWLRILRQPDGSLRTFISNAKAMNGTTIDGMPLLSGDMIVLKSGSKIKMGNTMVVFE